VSRTLTGNPDSAHKKSAELALASDLPCSRHVVSLPRQVLPGRFYMVNRRCAERRFFLRPDERLNNHFLYVLAFAAARCQIEVITTSVMSNHHHTIIYDPHGRVCEFMQLLHGFVARVGNALRGRWENFWSAEPACLVHLVSSEDVIDKLVYAATNPVKDHLVARVADWPGLNSLVIVPTGIGRPQPLSGPPGGCPGHWPGTRTVRTTIRHVGAGKRLALLLARVSLPRQVLPGRFYMVNRRCE
jgi:REP element-mobilizing transposase RayT